MNRSKRRLEISRVPSPGKYRKAREVAGYRAEGPHYYVWDEESERVESWMHELGEVARRPGDCGIRTEGMD